MPESAITTEPRDVPAAERRIAVVRLLVLGSLLLLLRWDVISPEGTIRLTGLTALLAVYVLATWLVLPRLPRVPRQDLLLTVDILAAAALVFFTGGIRSSLLFLLYLPVLAAAVRLDLRQTFLSAIAVSAIVVWMWSVAEGGLPSLGSAAVRVALFTSGSFLVAGFFGILAHETRLSRARASLNRVLDEKLAEATAQLRQHVAELESSQRLSRRLAEAAEALAVLEAVAEGARQQLDAPYSAVFLYDRLSGKLAVAQTSGITAEDASPMMYAWAERLGEVAERSLLVHAPDGVQWIRAACAPIEAGQSFAGVVCAGGPEGWTCQDPALQALATIADQAGVALQRAYLMEDLTRLALADPVTGLHSRDQLNRMLHQEVQRATHLESSFALLKVRVAGIVDSSSQDGRAATDLVLKQVASVILSVARRVDVVAHGERGEFFVLLPNTDLDAAKRFAATLHERLRDDPTVARMSAATQRLDPRIGIAVFPDDALTGPELYFCTENAIEAAEASGQGIGLSADTSQGASS